MKKLRDLVLVYALQNALFYGGKANASAVLGKVISQSSAARSNVNEARELVEQTVNQVNLMSQEMQKEKLKKLAPGMMEREKKEEGVLPELRGAVKGKVTTRFAPSPTGPLSLGQFLRAVVLSYAYAKKYSGKLIVRIEDTDAKKIEKDFYDMIREDLKNLGIEYDQLVLQSDRLESYYKYAEQLIEKNKAYVCFCPGEKFKKLKLEKKECPCREGGREKNLDSWKSMLSGEHKEGEAVLRLKLSMEDPNPVLRDPPLLRINKAVHPLKGNEYKVWPLYNFSCAVDDHDLGVTHVFRGKEHEHNTAVQKAISDIFGWKFPEVINFGMIRFPGEKIHTRDIKEMISEGKVTGWDDPKLPTVRSFLRRGFEPEALKQFAIECGLTKNDIEVSWEKLETVNRKIIDPKANRYMTVINPVKISVENAPDKKEVFEPLHPDFPRRGKKKMFVVNERIYISKEDFGNLKDQEIRLKGLYNIRLTKKPRYTGEAVEMKMPKIQWVSEPNVKVKIVKKDSVLEGLGELEMKNLKAGEIIQMERLGFARIDSKTGNEVTVYFAHK